MLPLHHISFETLGIEPRPIRPKRSNSPLTVLCLATMNGGYNTKSVVDLNHDSKFYPEILTEVTLHSPPHEYKWKVKWKGY